MLNNSNVETQKASLKSFKIVGCGFVLSLSKAAQIVCEIPVTLP
jgi:hypothetical protein